MTSSFKKILDGYLKVTVTRQNRDLCISKCRLMECQCSLVFCGAKIWNRLQKDLNALRLLNVLGEDCLTMYHLS